MNIIDKILIIDDEELDSFLHSSILKEFGYAKEIVVKRNGKEAIDYLQKDCQQSNQYPSLIFVDLYMPKSNGFDFLKEFDKIIIPNKYNIAVVVLSYSDNADDVIRLNKIGKFHFEQKPLCVEKMENVVHRYFRKSLAQIQHANKELLKY